MKKQWLIFAILIIVIAYLEFVIYYLGNKDNIKMPDLKQNISNIKTTYSTNKSKSHDKRHVSGKRVKQPGSSTNNRIHVKVNPPVSLSYKTKEEIYNIRKSYVAASIFASDNYTPSEAVFGGIEDNKPWWDVNNTCYNEKGEANVTGLSEEARFIANPALLVGIDALSIFRRTRKDGWCDKHADYTMKRLQPYSINFAKDKKKISVVYDGKLPFTDFSYNLKGINARDFGYNYVYMDRKKSRIYDITFDQENNVSNGVQELKDFFHTGGACKVAGGCNNASPYAPELSFNVHKSSRGELRTYIFFLKLWKNKPRSPEDEADMTERILFKR